MEYKDEYGAITPVPNHDGTACFKWDDTLWAKADHFKVTCWGARERERERECVRVCVRVLVCVRVCVCACVWIVRVWRACPPLGFI